MKQEVDLKNNRIKTTMTEEETAAIDAIRRQVIVKQHNRNVKENTIHAIIEVGKITIGMFLCALAMLGVVWLTRLG